MMAKFADKQAERGWSSAEITRHIMIEWRHPRLLYVICDSILFTQTGAAIYEKAEIVSTEVLKKTHTGQHL